MTIINTSPDRIIQLGYEGEDRVTVLRFRYGADWLENGEGIFHVRVRRHGENHAYNAELLTVDLTHMELLMTVTNVELSVKGSGEMQIVYSGADFVKKSPIYSYNVSRAVDEAVDPPAQDVYTQIIESLSDLQTDVSGIAGDVEQIEGSIGTLAELTTTDKSSLVSAINEVNAKSVDITVDDALSTTSTNPVQNRVVTSAIQGKADIQTVSALADAVQDLDGDVQGLQTAVQSKADAATVTALSGTVTSLQTTVQSKADTSTVTALSGTVSTLQSDVNELQADKAEQSDFSDLSENVATLWQTASQYMTQTETALSGLQTSKADKSYVDTQLAGKASAQTVSDLSDDVSDLQTGLAGKVEIPHTDEAKIAIQKMLGIYEAPWELINEETFTNESEADYIITTDADGNAFELTDLVFAFWLPKQSTPAKKGSYGQVRFIKNGTDMVRTESGAWEQQANSNPRGFVTSIEDRNGMVFVRQHTNALAGYTATATMRIPQNFDMTGGQTSIKFVGSDFYIDSINILAVTGTGHYKLYGKRKWT